MALNSWLKDLSFKHKLTVLMVLSAISVLTIAVLSDLWAKSNQIREYKVEKLQLLADLTAYNTIPALQFNDLENAQTLLESLRVDEQIRAATVFDNQSNRFAEYLRAEGSQPLHDEQ